jgi:hypothetical protein
MIARFLLTIQVSDKRKVLGSIHFIRHGKKRHDTTRQNILLWFSHARIHISPSTTAKDKDGVTGIDRREYFACLLTDGRYECTLVFVGSIHIIRYDTKKPACIHIYRQLTDRRNILFCQSQWHCLFLSLSLPVADLIVWIRAYQNHTRIFCHAVSCRVVSCRAA